MSSLAFCSHTQSSWQPPQVLYNQTGAATSVKLTESQDLIAQTKPLVACQNQNEALYRREMITLHMQMVEAADTQSQNPEIKSMAQETIKTSNAAINRMMEMRRKLYIVLMKMRGDDAR